MKTLLILVGAFAYVVSPLDLVPDIAPVVGWLDDVGVIALAVNSIRGKTKVKAVEAKHDVIDVA